MTLNDAHLVSQALRLCGGENIFGKLPQLAPTIGTEAVMEQDPEAIIATDSIQDSFSVWRKFHGMTAIARDNLFSINGDWMNRAGPRVLDGTEQLCKQLDLARARRK